MNDTVPNDTDPGPAQAATDRKIQGLSAEAARWRKLLRSEEERSRGLERELTQARSDNARLVAALRQFVGGEPK